MLAVLPRRSAGRPSPQLSVVPTSLQQGSAPSRLPKPLPEHGHRASDPFQRVARDATWMWQHFSSLKDTHRIVIDTPDQTSNPNYNGKLPLKPPPASRKTRPWFWTKKFPGIPMSRPSPESAEG